MPRITKDWINPYWEHGVDYANRRIFLMDEIYEESVRVVVQALKLFESMSTEAVELYIGTCGGDVYDMFCLFDVVRGSKCHIKTIGAGKVMSAGPLLVTAGDERCCYRNTVFMVHQAAWSSWQEKLSDQATTVRHMKEMEATWAKCMEERTETPAKKWARLLKGPDTYLDAVQAQELGIVEKILL